MIDSIKAGAVAICICFSGNVSSFHVDVHLQLTREVLRDFQDSPTYIVETEGAESEPLRFTKSRAFRLGLQNTLSDAGVRGGDPSYHFDDELFLQSDGNVRGWRRRLKTLLESPDPWSVSDDIIFNMGQALHIIQDFYSHSTWVERGEREILGFYEDKHSFPAVNPDLVVCDLNGRPLGGAELTSGYYPRGDIGKCSHGEVENRLPSGTPLVENVGNGPDTISKDFPGRFGYLVAKQLAALETINFVQSLINDLGDAGEIDGICALMGISEEKCPIFRITNIEFTDIVNTSFDGTPAPLDIFWDGGAEFPVRAHSSFSSDCRSFDCSIAALGQFFVEGNTTLFSESANPLTHLGRCFGFGASPFGGIIISADDVSVYFFLEDAQGATTNSVLVEYNCSYAP